ncbi:glutathione S-transferase U9-like [Durio zibethinus]|uniref:Glutathione S-transferase n=1 Tax=Durio zibethinus TaxID=66656 RepID=A0A6P5YCQ6_DURZI|nr:glutathione S-transferase U9-like [Durio zibethinus]
MGEENKVILHGMWASPFSKRVELALRLKGVRFEYVEEDLGNKTPQLLQYNPVYKKVPVLVHNGKPIAESLVILEYIDETWKNSPQLLPVDPYKRAKVRFWTSFIEQQLFKTMITVIKTDGEAQEKVIKEELEKLEVLEEGMKEFFPDGSPSIDSENVGLLDLVFCSSVGLEEIRKEVLGIQIIDPEKTPLIFSWLKAINQLPVVKEHTPPHDKLVAFLKFIRENALNSSST